MGCCVNNGIKMNNVNLNSSVADPFDLQRFIKAQQDYYSTALAEITQGKKQSHWIWFIFPQFIGLGHSPTASRYAIKSLAEARAYLEHPVLGPRLIQCAQAMLGLKGKSVRDILGCPDDLKLRSSATLFAQISEPDSVFHQILDKYYRNQADAITLQLIQD